jgi:hypothetical protein
MLLVEYWLLFWLFDSFLTLGFALGVCTHNLSFAFQDQAFSPRVDVASSFELLILLCLTNVDCVVGLLVVDSLE